MVVDDPSLRHRFTFKKEERLTSKKLIDELFKSGSFFYLYPFKVQWIETSCYTATPVQVLLAVPNRHFPHATDRNRIRRFMRESFRHSKHHLYEVLMREQRKIELAIIYTSKQEEPSNLIAKKMGIILEQLSERNETTIQVNK